jgi:hypothetical protein
MRIFGESRVVLSIRQTRQSAKGLQIRRSLRRQKNESNIQKQKGPTKVKMEAIDTKKINPEISKSA